MQELQEEVRQEASQLLKNETDLQFVFSHAQHHRHGETKLKKDTEFLRTTVASKEEKTPMVNAKLVSLAECCEIRKVALWDQKIVFELCVAALRES